MDVLDINWLQTASLDYHTSFQDSVFLNSPMYKFDLDMFLLGHFASHPKGFFLELEKKN